MADKKSDFEMLSYALNEEVEGVGWYDKYFADAEHPEVKALFRTIMIDEKKHAAALLQLLNKVAQPMLAQEDTIQKTTVFGGSILATHGYGMFNGFYMVVKDVPVTEVFRHIPTFTCGQLIESIAPIIIALVAMYYNEEKVKG